MKSALLLVDVQQNMIGGQYPVPSAEPLMTALSGLLELARGQGWQVIHIQNDGQPGDVDEPGTPGWMLAVEPLPGETLLRRVGPDTFSAHPQLAPRLRSRGVDTLVVAGLQSEYGVASTARGALAQGFHVVVHRGTHGTYDDETPGREKPAAAVSRLIEEELAAAGVEIRPAPEPS